MALYVMMTIYSVSSAKAEMNPPPKEHLGELLNSDISLQTDGFAG